MKELPFILSGVIKTFQGCRALSRYVTSTVVHTENHHGGDHNQEL